MDWWKKKKKKQAFDKEQTLLQCRKRGAMLLEDLIKCCNGKSNPIKFFSADLILKSTNNFSKSNHVSELQSYMWDWYSGINDNYKMILIKRYVHKLDIYNSAFSRDVVISSMVSGHKNFMKLVGCCLDLEYPVMVYYGERKQHSLIDFEEIVSWKRRMKIAEDIAIALAYLHTAFLTPFVYRNMNIDNVLLDENGVAKLSDLSCCISIPLGEDFVTVDELVGTFGYVDDDYIINHIVSEKTDAYGFGMFMLMLLVGEKIRLCKLTEEHDDGFNLMNPKWIIKFIEEGRLVDEIADRGMLDKMGEDVEEERCRMYAFLLLSMRCVGRKGEVPTMLEVTKELKKIQNSSQNASSSF